MEKMSIGLTETQRKETSEQLNRLVAEEHVLYIKTRQYHWNLKGAEFYTLHQEFENQYGELATSIDELAERVRKLGGYAYGSMRRFLENATLEEDVGTQSNPKKMVEALLTDHEQIIRFFRETIQKGTDVGTEDLLIGIVQKHEHIAWMLRSFLDKK